MLEKWWKKIRSKYMKKKWNGVLHIVVKKIHINRLFRQCLFFPPSKQINQFIIFVESQSVFFFCENSWPLMKRNNKCLGIDNPPINWYFGPVPWESFFTIFFSLSNNIGLGHLSILHIFTRDDDGEEYNFFEKD